jgi:hypothetical protein
MGRKCCNISVLYQESHHIFLPFSISELRITQQGVGWKSNPVEGKESQVVTFSGSEIKFATWMR